MAEEGDDTTNSFYETLTVGNVDKSVTAQDIKHHLLSGDELRFWPPYVSVCQPFSGKRQDSTYAEVTLPRIISREIISKYDNSLLKGKRICIFKECDKRFNLKPTTWRRLDTGIVTANLPVCRTHELGSGAIEKFYTLVDCGAFLVDNCFVVKKACSRVIDKAYVSGIEKFVIKSVNLRQAIKAKHLAEKYPGFVYFTAGVGPTELDKWNPQRWGDNLEYYTDLLRHPQCVGVGEVGINTTASNLEKQEEVFREQILLACQFNKPLIVVDQDETSHVLDILDEYSDRLLRVCVNGVWPTNDKVSQYTMKGYYFTISGQTFSDRSDESHLSFLEEFTDESKMSKILLSSQSPLGYPSMLEKAVPQRIDLFYACYGISARNLSAKITQLTTQQYLIHRNEPISLHSTLELLSLFTKIKPEMLASITGENAYRFYDFKQSDEMLRCSSDESANEKKCTATGNDLQASRNGDDRDVNNSRDSNDTNTQATVDNRNINISALCNSSEIPISTDTNMNSALDSRNINNNLSGNSRNINNNLSGNSRDKNIKTSPDYNIDESYENPNIYLIAAEESINVDSCESSEFCRGDIGDNIDNESVMKEQSGQDKISRHSKYGSWQVILSCASLAAAVLIAYYFRSQLKESFNI